MKRGTGKTMSKTILITGATDGIGLETACKLSAAGHTLLLHGRNPDKLAAAKARVSAEPGAGEVETWLADFSDLADVARMGSEIASTHERLDVVINNAGILKSPVEMTPAGLDIRFVVNLLAPVLLTQKLLPLMGQGGRVVNLSSAAQAPVDPAALAGKRQLSAMDAYAQSKLALTMWTRHLAQDLAGKGPLIVAVNPGSLLASKMVKQGFGIAGNDLGIGADILVRAAVSEEFASVNGLYFDNDSGRFSDPHPGGLNDARTAELMEQVTQLLAAHA